MYKSKIIAGGTYQSFETELNKLFASFPVNAELVSIQHITGTYGRFHGGYGELNTKNDILVVWKE